MEDLRDLKPLETLQKDAVARRLHLLSRMFDDFLYSSTDDLLLLKV